MMIRLGFPSDAVSMPYMDFCATADFMELCAFFSSTGPALTSVLVNEAMIGAEEDYEGLDAEHRYGGEELVSGTVNEMENRRRYLRDAYPFAVDDRGEVVKCVMTHRSLGHVAYVLSLLLSNLRSVSPILSGSIVHPTDSEVRRLRKYFEYFATAALAAEIQGNAWSFGFPRPDGSSFLKKLDEIWMEFGDGRVGRRVGARRYPKDDGVDVFAARQHPDRLPGFLLAAAQVSTGKHTDTKSLRGVIPRFFGRWFVEQPTTDVIPYVIIPFARDRGGFVDDVRKYGNVLHRLRVPRRVVEASALVEAGVTVEGYDRLGEASKWVSEYRRRMEVEQ